MDIHRRDMWYVVVTATFSGCLNGSRSQTDSDEYRALNKRISARTLSSVPENETVVPADEHNLTEIESAEVVLDGAVEELYTSTSYSVTPEELDAFENATADYDYYEEYGGGYLVEHDDYVVLIRITEGGYPG